MGDDQGDREARPNLQEVLSELLGLLPDRREARIAELGLSESEERELRRRLARADATARLPDDGSPDAARELAQEFRHAELMARAPHQIGPYRVLSVLGEGGMGTVYKAEQREPIRRTVALKLVKLGLDTREVLARFASERQALARMDHPHIAKVLDAGTSESGQPYFVMEYVPGVPITRFCDENKLSIRDRLELFRQVCDAISHAHTKAIIHRDVKAGNVLAYIQDGRPCVKVIDFGIAKALTSDRLTDLTFDTRLGHAVGTYDSMSPEQADGSPDIDTRTDVYALGVLLYELLTGVKPFDFRAVADQEIRRVIRTIDPPPPSTRLTKLGDKASELAQSRQTRLEQLTRQLRRELEWIPLMAMRKDRERRYTSPLQLNEDVARYLSGKPLLAGPESRLYRSRKWLAAHKVAVATAVVLLTAVTGMLASWQRVGEASRREEAAQVYSSAIEAFVTDDVVGALAPTGEAPEAFVSAVRASGNLLVDRFAASPEVEFRFRLAFADALARLGDLDQAGSHIQRAKLLRAAHRPADVRWGIKLDLIEAAWLWRHQNATSIELLRRTLQDAEEQLGPADPLTVTCLNDLAGALKNTNKDAALESRLEVLAEAERLYRLSVERRTTGLGPKALATLESRISLAQLPIERAVALSRYARSLSQGDPRAEILTSEAEQEFRAALAAMQAVESDAAQAFGPESRPAIEAASESVKLLHRLKQWSDADSSYSELVPRMQKVLGAQHWRTEQILLSWEALLIGGAKHNLLDQERIAKSYPIVLRGFLEAGPPGIDDALRVCDQMCGWLELVGRSSEAARWRTWAQAMRSIRLGGEAKAQ